MEGKELELICLRATTDVENSLEKKNWAKGGRQDSLKGNSNLPHFLGDASSTIKDTRLWKKKDEEGEQRTTTHDRNERYISYPYR